MPIIDHFGIIAPFYDRAIPLRNAKIIIDLIDLPSNGGSLLDVGGGTGRVAEVLKDLASPIIVVDLSHHMLRQANAKGGLESVSAESEKLPFPDKSFDRIIMVDALHHVIDHHSTTAEMWRVLKVGGRIIIEEPDVRKWGVKLVAIAEKLALMRSHFINPMRIAMLFDYPNAITNIFIDGHNAWVSVDKNSDQGEVNG